MTIGIEAERANNPIKTGVEHYAQQLILHLAQIDRQNNYILYLRSKPEHWFFTLPKNFKVKVMPFPLFWTQARISLEMLFHPVDVLFIPASALPLIHPKNSVVTIHDLAWKYFPEAFTGFMRNYLEWSAGFAVRRAKKIIAPSFATRNDVVKAYGAPPDKIAVIPHGYEPNQTQAEKVSPDLAKQLPEKFILFVSTLQPRKNLEKLIDAFRKLRQQHPEIAHKLVVAGKPGWKFAGILKKIDENKDIVVYLGHVDNQDKWALYRKASALVMPSLYEGFGLWILEAFDAGVPVVTSNISSMPEVAGDAAVYCDPNSEADIEQAMVKVLTDSGLIESLRQKGQERLARFGWKKCAEQTLELFNSLNS